VEAAIAMSNSFIKIITRGSLSVETNDEDMRRARAAQHSAQTQSPASDAEKPVLQHGYCTAPPTSLVATLESKMSKPRQRQADI
jgi:hypothetical protein